MSNLRDQPVLRTAAPAPGRPSAAAPRLAYLVSRYPAVSHTFILREVLQLRESGFDIAVASINEPDRSPADMTPDEREEAARTYYVKRHGIRGALAACVVALREPAACLRGLRAALELGHGNPRQIAFNLFYLTEALMLARWMRARDMHHLHVHFATAAASVALILKRAFPVGLSLTVHGPDEFYDASGQWLKDKFEAADFVVSISRFARSQLMQLTAARHWSKFDVCPLGVDAEGYVPAAKTAGDRPFNILCVGRLTPAKGQRILVDACAALAAEGRDFRLVMVGAGPDEADLKAAVAAHGLDARVEFTGPLNQAQVRERYAAADIFALPSFSEGVPVVLMEAMASGVPCVTTRITGIPELIDDGESGLLVTPSDSAQLAGAIVRLMDDPALRIRIAATARAKVRETHDLRRNVARLADIFQHRLGSLT